MRVGTLLLFIIISAYSVFGYAQKISPEEYEALYSDATYLEEKLEDIETSFEMNKAFYSYKESFVAYLESLKPRKSSKSTLMNKAKAADLILFGDDHSNPRSQSNFIELIKAAASSRSNQPIAVVIEWVDKKHQSSLDRFMNDEINAAELRKQIDFDESWGFAWEPHLEILKAAKAIGAHVIAAENKMNKNAKSIYLRTRDNNIVRTISNYKESHPNARILVSYGTYHLAGGEDGHLKEKLEAIGMTPDMVVYPYSNGGYWKTLKRTLDMDQARVMKFSDTEYFYYQGSVERVIHNLRHYMGITGNSSLIELLKRHLKTKGIEPSKGCDSLLTAS